MFQRIFVHITAFPKVEYKKFISRVVCLSQFFILFYFKIQNSNAADIEGISF